MEIAKHRQTLTRLGGMFAVSAILLQTHLPLKGEIGLIRLYQRFGSPLTSYMTTCRYHPTCSEYALVVLTEHGFWKGNLKLAMRMLLCSPLGSVVD